MSGTDVHELVAGLAEPDDGSAQRIVDIGAGRGATLAVLAADNRPASLTAVDISDEALADIATRLPGVCRIKHDLADPLPFPDDAFDVVVSHNTLECLVHPERLLREIGRILRPGGRLVLSHTDFETLVVATDDRKLSRRVLLTYAELAIPYRHMATADPQTGRRLLGLVRRSPLQVRSVQAHTTVIPTLDVAEQARLNEVAAVARRSATRGLGRVSMAEVDEWVRQLRSAEQSGDFIFSETTFVVAADAN